ncbi:MAG TPA: Hpt domain-containing protein [Xanthobacteraceae bacterium]|nr:Hpt domain-containing protein [Xanthobacteraceae bacterium]
MEPARDGADGPKLVPHLEAIDFQHLARMTLGEQHLEAEVLRLFDQQARVLLAHMRACSPEAAAAFAHTLRGSATGIGAWRVAAAAGAVERQASSRAGAGIAEAVSRLAAAIEEARAAIAHQLEASKLEQNG